VKAPAFDYERARDAAHAVSLLAEAAGSARPIAGGQSLGPMLNLRLVRPELLVDVRACPDLRGVIDEGDAIVYGAAVTHAEIEDGTVPDALGSRLAVAAREIAYRAVRNRGTLGGSLVHADPAADWPTVLLAAGAEVVVRGPGGLRAESLGEFLTGPFSVSLGSDELLVGVRVAKRGAELRWGYHKICVKAGEFARAFAVAMEDRASGERRAVVGAIERVPLVLEGDDAVIDDPRRAEALLARRLPSLAPLSLRLNAVALARAGRALASNGDGR
jgi:carbon-monoxide dehydrogenase medium subunit